MKGQGSGLRVLQGFEGQGISLRARCFFTKASSVELAGVVVYPCTGIHLVKKLPGKKRVPHLNRSETQDLRWGLGGGGAPPPPLTSP